MILKTFDELLLFISKRAEEQLDINEFMNLPEIKDLLRRVEINLKNKYINAEDKENEFSEFSESKLYIMGEYIKCYNAVKQVSEEDLKALIQKLIKMDK